MEKTREKMNKIETIEAKRALIVKWPKRILRLKEKKNLKQVEFCRVHGLEMTRLCRSKKFAHIPHWNFIDAVEKALEAEGV